MIKRTQNLLLMKKTIKILALILLIFLGALISIPYFFQGEITSKIKQEINKTLNAEVDFSDLNISLIKQFPDASIVLSGFTIVSNTAYKNDTLVQVKEITLTTSIPELISKNPKVNYIAIANANIHLKTNKEGLTNYDIIKPSDSTKTTATESSTGESLSLHVDSYSLKNINFYYTDESSNLISKIENLNHSGSGKFSSEHLNLNTESSIEKINVTYDGVHYLSNISFDWKALLDINLNDSKVTFKENLAHINDLNISFHGSITSTENAIQTALDFSSKDLKFSSILSLIPSVYSQSLEGVKTTGNTSISGKVNGAYNKSTIPTFSIVMSAENASFQYPDLPKTVKHINILTEVNNTSGIINDTKVSINKFNFQIDKDVFNATSTITNLTTNPTVVASANGTINLENLSHAYPINLEEELSGKLIANINTAFNLEAIDKNNFKEIKNEGNLQLENFTLLSDIFPKPLLISNAKLDFNPKYIALNKFEATTGDSDLSIKGKINNYYGYAFDDKNLEGKFKMYSKKVNTSDLLSETDSTSTANKEIVTPTDTAPLKIPEKIDIIIEATAEEVLYDNLILNKLNGELHIKDQRLTFKKTEAKMLKGKINILGYVNTKPTPSDYNLKLDIKEFDIATAFNQLELFTFLAPFANAMSGKVSTSMDLNGLLNNDLTANLKATSGKVDALMDVKDINTEKSKTLQLIDNKLGFIDMSKLDIKKIATKFQFKNEKVNFEPFTLAKYDGNPIQFSGNHSFDNQIDYKLSTNIPAKKMGKQVTSLIQNLPEKEQDKIIVPFTIDLQGDIKKPEVKVDLQATMNTLSKKVASSQKEQLIDKLLNANKKENDSTPQTKDDLKKAATNILKGLF